jgi:hypothetical protein
LLDIPIKTLYASLIIKYERRCFMDTFEKVIEFQRELLQSQLKVVYRYQQQSPHHREKAKRTSKLDIVEDILASYKQPLHISKIIEIAQNDYRVTLERDSIVSALIKKIKAGSRFVRVAPNTFDLKKEPNE